MFQILYGSVFEDFASHHVKFISIARKQKSMSQASNKMFNAYTRLIVKHQYYSNTLSVLQKCCLYILSCPSANQTCFMNSFSTIVVETVSNMCCNIIKKLYKKCYGRFQTAQKKQCENKYIFPLNQKKRYANQTPSSHGLFKMFTTN